MSFHDLDNAFAKSRKVVVPESVPQQWQRENYKAKQPDSVHVKGPGKHEVPRYRNSDKSRQIPTARQSLPQADHNHNLHHHLQTYSQTFAHPQLLEYAYRPDAGYRSPYLPLQSFPRSLYPPPPPRPLPDPQVPPPPAFTPHNGAPYSTVVARRNLVLTGANNSYHPAASHSSTISSTAKVEVDSNEVPIIQPLDKTKRRPFDISKFKTAEDLADAILLAAGIHPTLGGLNYNLLWVLDDFGPEVNAQSDLSTFRWDLVGFNEHPGVDCNRPNTYTPPTADMMHPQAREHGVGGIPVGGQGLVRRPFDPTPRQPSLLRNNSTPNPGSRFSVVVNSPSQTQSPSQSLYPNTAQNTNTLGPVQPAANFTNFPLQSKSTSMLEGGYKFERQVRDSSVRAPSTPRPGSLPKSASTPRVEIISPGPSSMKRGRPRREVNYTIPPSLTPKKRGRPFSTPDAAARAAAKAEGRASQAPKKRGRPFQKFEHTFIEQEAEYLPFLCEWKDCPAELINLETLRNHIFSVHMRHNKDTRCLWAQCKASHEEKDQLHKPAKGNPSFNSEREFKEHVNKTHLIPFAWHMGDGPKESSSSGASKSKRNDFWLFDESGKQVTPSVDKQPTESGYAKLNNKKRFVKRRDSDGEVYIVPIGSEAYGKVQESTDYDDKEVRIDMATSSKTKSSLSIVLNSHSVQESHKKVFEPNEESNRMGHGNTRGGLGSEMEID